MINQAGLFHTENVSSKYIIRSYSIKQRQKVNT